MLSFRSTTGLFRLLLLSADALLIGLHLCHRLTDWSLFSTPEFDISFPHGLAESFNYLELLWIALLLIWFSRRQRRPAVLAWAVLFGYLLVDDLLKLHEPTGEGVVSLLNDDPDRYLVGGLRTQDLGEITIITAAVLPVLVVLVRNYRRGSEPARRIDRRLTQFLLVFATFAIGVDLIGELVTTDAARFVFGLIEDGGELVILSLITAYVFSLHTAESRDAVGLDTSGTTGAASSADR